MEIENQKIGSESGHWYDANGLVKAVPRADGKGMTDSQPCNRQGLLRG